MTHRQSAAAIGGPSRKCNVPATLEWRLRSTGHALGDGAGVPILCRPQRKASFRRVFSRLPASSAMPISPASPSVAVEGILRGTPDAQQRCEDEDYHPRHAQVFESHTITSSPWTIAKSGLTFLEGSKSQLSIKFTQMSSDAFFDASDGAAS